MHQNYLSAWLGSDFLGEITAFRRKPLTGLEVSRMEVKGDERDGCITTGCINFLVFLPPKCEIMEQLKA